MMCPRNILNIAVAAAISLVALPVVGQDLPQLEPPENAPLPVPDHAPAPAGQDPVAPERIDQLLLDLKRPDNSGWRRTERQVMTEWSKSGSAAMDLLLSRGRDALREDNVPAAIEHLSALTEHAPDFAEGWNTHASALFHGGYYGPAVASLAKALTLNPQHYGAMAGMGAILAETGNDKAALEAYRRALAIHPHLERIKEAVERLEQKLAGRQI